jgi:hypothetical protein
MSIGISIPKISINTEINANVSPPFLGRVSRDEIQEGKFKETAPYQWVISVKPLTFPTKNLGFSEFVKIKPKNLQGEISDNSQLGMHMKAFKAIFSDVDANIGEDAYLDRVAWFQKSEFVYPPNKDGEQFKTNLLLPVREATPEELEAVGEAPVAPKSTELTDADAEAVLAALEGKKQGQFQKAVFTAKLAPGLIQAVVNGSALEYLTSTGRATITEDGVLARA